MSEQVRVKAARPLPQPARLGGLDSPRDKFGEVWMALVDRIGCPRISRTGAMLFFQLMTRRYEQASTVRIERALEEMKAA